MHSSTTDERDYPVVPSQVGARVALGLLQANSGADLISQATELASRLANVIKDRKLSNFLGNREYVRVEGWTTLAALMGVIPTEVSVEMDTDGTYTATVALIRMSDKTELNKATSECGMDEPRWSQMPRYARRSMAVTRATGKACRLAFSWVMALAGYDPTPYEEMEALGPHPEAPPQQQPTQTAPEQPPRPVQPPAPARYESGLRLASLKQIKLIGVRMDRAHVTLAELLERMDLATLDALPAARVDDALSLIESIKNGTAPPRERIATPTFDFDDEIPH